MYNEIQKLKKEKDAIILAHFYQSAQVKEAADYVGDSFELAKKAKSSSSGTIVFCGVKFMAESAKLLNPQKTVLLAESTAGCPMADMLKAEDIIRLRAKYPKAAVVLYINSSVEAKAQSDVCCTSSNAAKIIKKLPNKQIIFLPDKNLGSYIARFTDKEIILFDGYCHVHDKITIDDLIKAKQAYPKALVAVHPECRAEIVDAADFCGSTSQIISYAALSNAKEFIIGTEQGVIDVLEKNHSDKKFYPLSDNFICPNMKKTLLEDVRNCLKYNLNSIEIEPSVFDNAAKSLELMMELAK
ncbi:MAG: quinolinate synthase NadA [Candidatus Saccharimonadaceae bacterium]|nr:quinolinate synthase NadA [Candidatus Saccharimonadaceae bacterium]MDD4002709.1 quinolinate synthase NadA [Clostridia bacterium]